MVKDLELSKGTGVDIRYVGQCLTQNNQLKFILFKNNYLVSCGIKMVFGNFLV